MNLNPDLTTFARTFNAGKNQIVSAVRAGEGETPVSAARKLGGKPYSFLLESMEGGAARGRYSIIGRAPDLIWRCERGGKAAINREALKGGKFVASKRAPLEDLRALLSECRIDDPHLPPPVAAGLFGYLGYDMVRYMERLADNKPPGVETPEALLIRPTLLAIFDQVENKITLVTPVWFDKAQTAETAYTAAKQRLEGALSDLAQSIPYSSTVIPAKAGIHHPVSTSALNSQTTRLRHAQEMDPRLRGDDTEVSEPAANMSESGYCAMVERAKEYIRAGDIFQVVLSQRFSLPFSQPPFDLYRAIRRLDPSPYLYFFDFGDFSVVGSSPEILVRVRGGKVTIRPIAGTRPRGIGNRSDKELAAELLADPKELAEHLMLLDLGRNDAGRVATPGTVKVTAQNTIEYYKHVMHIVSNVEAELDKKFTPLEALAAGFPAGTVSGAPKVRAMEIIQELEPDRRGIYAGCVGYFGANGDMDTAIAIRTAVIKDGTMYVQAGAGIVYDSDAHSEHRECVAKARGMMKAAEEAAKD